MISLSGALFIFVKARRIAFSLSLWLYYANLWALGNSMERTDLLVFRESGSVCQCVSAAWPMSDITQGQSFNMWLVMYIFETTLKTGLWQTTLKVGGCCVSLVTFMALVSMWCFIFSYAHQEFSVPHSVKLDAKIQMVVSTTWSEKWPQKGLK